MSSCSPAPRYTSSCKSSLSLQNLPGLNNIQSPAAPSRKGLHLRSSRILLAATATLFASTTVYFAYELAYAAVASRISTDVALALTASPTAPLPVDAHMLGHAARFDAVLTCVSAVTVTVNVRPLVCGKDGWADMARRR